MVDRKIKFRGKRVDTKEWVYGDFVTDTDGGANYIVERAYWHCEDSIDQTLYCEVDPATIGQYTGLHDKNGKEIFEGDVVLSSACSAIVKIGEFVPEVLENWSMQFQNKFMGKIMGVFLEILPPNGNAGQQCFISNGNIVEVIGNIHDNPELISQKQKSEDKADGN